MARQVGKSVSYRAAPSAPFRQEAAPAIGRRLEELEGEGPVTPERVVEDATFSASPLHPYFTWDDTEAARKQRLSEARNLVNHLIVVVTHKGQQTETKGWHSVRIVTSEDGESERAYASLSTVESHQGLRAQVVAQALHQAASWRRRYAQYAELLPIVEAIDRTMAELGTDPESAAG